MDRDTDFKRKLYLQRLKHREGHRPRRTFAHGARERPGLQSPELLYDIVYEDREEHPILRCLPEGCGSVVLRRKFVSSTLWNKYEDVGFKVSARTTNASKHRVAFRFHIRQRRGDGTEISRS